MFNCKIVLQRVLGWRRAPGPGAPGQPNLIPAADDSTGLLRAAHRRRARVVDLLLPVNDPLEGNVERCGVPPGIAAGLARDFCCPCQIQAGRNPCNATTCRQRWQLCFGRWIARERETDSTRPCMAAGFPEKCSPGNNPVRSSPAHPTHRRPCSRGTLHVEPVPGRNGLRKSA